VHTSSILYPANEKTSSGANAKRPDSFIKTDKSASAGNFKLFAPTVCGYLIIFLF